MTTIARTRAREIAARLLATLGVALGFAVISADAGAGLAGGILVGTTCNDVGNFLTQGLSPATPSGLAGSLSSPSPQNPPFTIPPCAGTDPFLGPYTGSADVTSFVDYGVMKTIGHASASGLLGGGQSSTHLIFSDLVTFDPVNSQFMGMSATVQARMQLQALLTGAAKWWLDVTVGGTTETFSSNEALDTLGLARDCSSPCTFDLTWLGIPLNTPTQLQVDLNAIDVATGDASLSLVSSSMDLSQSVYWDGIQSVTVGGEPIAFDLISNSGHDWTQSSVPSLDGLVPEPGSLALVALGLAGLGAARCRVRVSRSV